MQNSEPSFFKEFLVSNAFLATVFVKTRFGALLLDVATVAQRLEPTVAKQTMPKLVWQEISIG